MKKINQNLKYYISIFFNKTQNLILTIFSLVILYMAMFIHNFILSIFAPTAYNLRYAPLNTLNQKWTSLFWFLSLLFVFSSKILLGWKFLFSIKLILYALLILNSLWTLYTMVFHWHTLQMSRSFISDIVTFFKNGYRLGETEGKSFAASAIVVDFNSSWIIGFLSTFKNKPMKTLFLFILDVGASIAIESKMLKVSEYVWSEPWLYLVWRFPFLTRILFRTLVKLIFALIITNIFIALGISLVV